MAEESAISPPSPWLLLIEGRAVWELASTYATLPILRCGPRGDGHPVLLLPGFLASDFSTTPLRRFLKSMGFSTHPWLLGRNLGPRGDLEDRLMARLEALAERYDRKVSLVGWSLGGIYARMLANRAPDKVRSVVTLGSPFNHDPRANHSWKLFEKVTERSIDEVPEETFQHIRNPPPVPTTSVYSKTDGIAAWACCRDDTDGPLNENVEVPGSHLGLGVNPLVYHLLLDRLNQPEGEWQPFARSGLRALFFAEENGTPEPAVS
jgi:pimeloyl-ACP methyl ester carboxylesterase